MSTSRDTGNNKHADLIITNGRISTQDERRSFASAAAIKGGRFVAVGTDGDVMAYRGVGTDLIDIGAEPPVITHLVAERDRKEPR